MTLKYNMVKQIGASLQGSVAKAPGMFRRLVHTFEML
jgi:hypothetical protein